MISKETYEVIMANADRLNSAVIYDRDFGYVSSFSSAVYIQSNFTDAPALQNYFGFKTLERSYLLRIDGKVAERPQHMLMRVAVGIHGSDIERVLQSYNLMSERFFTHASPTLFNAGTPHPQLSSCFLVTMKDDSIEGIYDTLKTCALISKTAGGIGLSIHNIRATGSYIAGTNGYSNGIIPMLRVYNNTARYVDQGGNKRPGAFAIYLEPWHADIFEFLDLRKNHGKEEVRARDLFFALWIPDLFMERVEEAGDWPLFCPAEAPGLHEVYGDEFKALFTQYEKEGRAKKTIPAQKLWYAILEAQVETGNPFMLYKDAANSTSLPLELLASPSLTSFHRLQRSPTRATSVRSSRRTSALRLSSTLPPTSGKSSPSASAPSFRSHISASALSATSLRSLSPLSSRTESTTSRSSTRSSRCALARQSPLAESRN